MMFRNVILILQLCCYCHCHKNILFLVADDMRPNLGVYEESNKGIFNHPQMHTPNLDRLASKSLLFERAYAVQALCSPSRTSTMTSRRPDTTKVHQIGLYWRDYGGNFTTIPQFFKENGYTAIGSGKIFHKGPSSNNHDCEYSWSSCPYYRPQNMKYGKSHKSWISLSKDKKEEFPQQDTSSVDWILPRLEEASNEYKTNGNPFFIAFGAHIPHHPWVFPEEFLDFYPEDSIQVPDNPYCPIKMPSLAWNVPPMFKDYQDIKDLKIPHLEKMNVTLPDWKVKELRRAYYAAISYSDYEIGRVLNKLETLGIANDTIISFWSDHGFHLGEHAEWGKHNLFDISNRVPFMISIPGLTDNGMKSSKLVELVDLFPTLVEAAGFQKLPKCSKRSNHQKLCTEGRSLLPLFRDPESKSWDEAVFWQYPKGGFEDDVVPKQMGYSIRVPGFRYTEYVWIKNLGNHKYIPVWNYPADHEELYDHRIDPQENVNRYDKPEYKAIKIGLSNRLRLGWHYRD